MRVSKQGAPGMPRRVSIAVAALAAMAVVVAAVQLDTVQRTDELLLLVPFVGLVMMAESLHVRFRIKGQSEAFNLLEAVLAPLVFAFSGPLAMVVALLGHLLAGLVRKNDSVKVLFNAVSWALAVGLASMAFHALNEGTGFGAQNLGALAVAMVVMGAVNQITLIFIISLAQRSSLKTVLLGLSPVILPGWCVAWAFNTLIGVLFVFAYQASVIASLLFYVPLVVLHAAYSGYASTQSDRARMAGLHRASQVLAEAQDSSEGIAAFLSEVGRSFEAREAELVLLEPDGILVHSVSDGDPSTYMRFVDDRGADGVRSQLLISAQQTRRFETEELDGPLRAAFAEAGIQDCLVTSLPENDTVTGVLAVYDQDGLQGFAEGERAILEALARETANSFEKGRLFASLTNERSRLSSIVESTHDGVFSINETVRVRAWNSAWSNITGRDSVSAMGRTLCEVQRFFDADGSAVDFRNWTKRSIRTMPAEMTMLDAAGVQHTLRCTYRIEDGELLDERLLTIVAHDITESLEVERLEEEIDRLAEREQAQRERVLELQESLQPSPPAVAQAEFGVHYLPSDDDAPTGGDFYDWQVLPNGDVHVAVVDVLGHGVDATNDAFAVVHTLRTLAFQGEELTTLVRSADKLLANVNPELVATVMVARYSPESGNVTLAGGGHPPALRVRGDGAVEEIAAPGIPVGWPGAGSERAVHFTLEPSDTLVLYTDGLIEADRDILVGLEALARNASEIRMMPAEEMAEALVARSLANASRRDDTLALVLHHVGSDQPTKRGSLTHRESPLPEAVPAMRRAFRSWADAQSLHEEAIDDLAVAVSELSTNAMRSATKYVELRAQMIGSAVLLEVEDDGPGFDGNRQLTRQSLPSDESGRGLAIVAALVDDVEFAMTPNACTVRLHRFGVRPSVRSRPTIQAEPIAD